LEGVQILGMYRNIYIKHKVGRPKWYPLSEKCSYRQVDKFASFIRISKEAANEVILVVSEQFWRVHNHYMCKQVLCNHLKYKELQVHTSDL
jgi:hypothetical protein